MKGSDPAPPVVLPGDTDLAKKAVRMAMSHQQHQANRRQHPEEFCCKGWSDPLTNRFCQFSGSEREQHQHMIDRVAAMIAHGREVALHA